jgi:hypothetical protein
MLNAPRRNLLIRRSIAVILRTEKKPDGGVGPGHSIAVSDVCVNGMFLNYASYFGAACTHLESIVDFILEQRMADGGFNCQRNRGGARHSSLHSTLSVLEGIESYRQAGYDYRLDDLLAAAAAGREFMLRHRLFRSDHTGAVIRPEFLRFAYPPRWRYNILRALDYLRSVGMGWDDRLAEALEIVESRRRRDGTWMLPAAIPGEVHFAMEETGRPSRWNTLLALRIGKHLRNRDELRTKPLAQTGERSA